MEVEVITERLVLCPLKGKVLLEDCRQCEHFNYDIGAFGLVEKINCKSDEKVNE